MLPVTLYLKLLRLKSSNKNLLKIYTSLYYKLEDGIEAEWTKSGINHRIKLREEIKNELNNYLHSFSGKGESFFNRAAFLCLPEFVNAEFSLYNNLRKHDVQNCQNCENENIRQYYTILYMQGLPQDITNLLLEQKAQIETMVLKEI